MTDESKRLLYYTLPVFLVVLGSKLLFIQLFGSNLPFWDQWDAEGAGLFKPYLEGTLGPEHLFASHNEHRILFTRLLELAMLEATGVWAPRLEMAVNAGLQSFFQTALLWILLRPLADRHRLVLTIFAAIFLTIPFGWENTLSGFQSQFYFLFGFSILALWLSASAPAFGRNWLGGLVAGIAAYFSLSSGAMVFAALAAIHGFQLVAGPRSRTPKEIAGLVLEAALFVCAISYVAHIPAHERLQAHGLLDFLGAFTDVAGWPWGGIVLAILINAPLLSILYKSWREPHPLSSFQWTLLAFAFWLGGQWITLAYGRAAGPTASRYRDTLLLGPLLNMAAVLYLAQFETWRNKSLDLYRKRISALGPRRTRIAAGFLVLVVAGVVIAGYTDQYLQASERGYLLQVETGNVKAFLRTGDMGHLENKPDLHIPYPDPQRLARLATDPTILSVLHPDLTGRAFSDRLLLPHWLTESVRFLLSALIQLWGPILLAGLVLLGRLLLRRTDRLREDAT
ncbi:hypothetical protein FHS78_000978 [Parvibaculum indicum]|uniref:hypothetical protein n=1 Tax=Parvibaculum indicum TaxID=562969 RepID=UPI0014235117|nr:hypothetical protein [Parvibaculum indicum]NIJ40702.1 hypothetical protein [Parvibaculum indicum]